MNSAIEPKKYDKSENFLIIFPKIWTEKAVDGLPDAD